MPGMMTLRLESTDHLLLLLLSVLFGKSANQIIVDLVRAEVDRQLPGKREALVSRGLVSGGEEHGTAQERLRALLRQPPLAEDAGADRALDAALAQAQADADAIYGDLDRTVG
jgi:hypothetical protein